jgi:hypothetical protein
MAITAPGEGTSLADVAIGSDKGLPAPLYTFVSGTWGPAAASANGLTVAQGGTWSFGLTGSLPAGANTIGAVTVSGSVAVTGPLTDAQLRATAVPVSGTFWQATQPVSAASLPLPSGAATAANQTTANASLASIDGKLTSPITISGAVAMAADKVNVGGTDLTPKFAAIAASASGDNTAVAAVTGKKIRVLAYTVVAAGAVSAKFQSDTTDLTGALSFAANGGASVAFSPVGHFETASGVALQLNLGSAVAVGGHLVYVEV